MRRSATRVAIGSVLVAALIAIVAGQALTDSAAPRGLTSSAAGSVGRAGSAFLEGLRVFAAVVIWNRLEPQEHEYYETRTIAEMTFLVPNLRLVVLLDPQFQQAYYVLPWILARNGKVSEGLALAREGIANNPRSGILWASYAQILLVAAKDKAAAARAADHVLDPRSEWTDPRLQWDALNIAIGTFEQAGMTAKMRQAQALAARVDQRIHSEGLDRSGHSHTGGAEEGPSW